MTPIKCPWSLCGGFKPAGKGDGGSCDGKKALVRRTGPHRRALPEKSYLPSDEVLKHRALPRTLSTHNGDLGQVQVRILTDGREGILHTVHQRNQVLHSPVAHLGDAPSCLSSS